MGIVLGARYDGSPLIVGDGSRPPPDDSAKYTPSTIPGGRLPHYWIGDKESIFDKLGPWFNVLKIGPEAPSVAAFEKAAADLCIPIRIVEVAEPGTLRLYGSNILLVRPDQHIAWRGNVVPEDVYSLMEVIVGK